MNQYKILLVEDDAEISEMLSSYLTAENYDVVCAFDGQEACAKFEGAGLHLVLLDLMIPKISRMDVMRHIRKKRRCSAHHPLRKGYGERQDAGPGAGGGRLHYKALLGGGGSGADPGGSAQDEPV